MADQVLLVATHDDCRFRIQEGRGEGYYVFRFVGDDLRPTHDYLQDDIETAKHFAWEQWGVPETAWRPAS